MTGKYDVGKNGLLSGSLKNAAMLSSPKSSNAFSPKRITNVFELPMNFKQPMHAKKLAKSDAVHCAMPGCKSSTFNCVFVRYFSFPEDDDRCKQWILACHLSTLLDKPSSFIHRNYYLCQGHFTEDQFLGKERKKLKYFAVPETPTYLNQTSQPDYSSSEDVESNMVNEDMLLKSEPQEDFSQRDTSEFDNLECLDEEDYDEDAHDICEDNFTKNERFCRLCANLVKDAVYIFGPEGQKMGIADNINLNLPITVDESDPFPKQLCQSCMLKLVECQNFMDSCVRAEKKFQILLEQGAFSLEDGSLQEDSAGVAECMNGCSTPCDKHIFVKYENYEKLGTVVKQEPSVKELFVPSLPGGLSRKLNCPLCCEGHMNFGKSENDFDEADCVESADSQMAEVDMESSVVSVVDNINGSAHEENSLEIVTSEQIENNGNPIANLLSNDQLDGNVIYSVVDEEGNEYAMVGPSEDFMNTVNSLSGTEYIVKTMSEQNDFVQDVEEGEVMDVSVEEGQTCVVCGETFTSEEECLTHGQQHTEDPPTCCLCGLSFENTEMLTAHTEEHRQSAGRQSKRLQCGTCGRRFNSAKTWRRHSCDSVEPCHKQYRCEICRKCYSSEERLVFHVRFHNGARLNHCERCGKDFDNEGSLYYHTRLVHDGERPFGCDLCSKRFYSNSRLVSHKRVHTGERPFECEVCGRRFYDRETLKGHYVTHLPIKPFQCDVCGAYCGRKSMLKKHMRVHHSNSHAPKRAPSLIHYACKICGVTFTSSLDVITHRTTHWGTKKMSEDGVEEEKKESKPHVCEYCGQGFAFVSALGKHRKQEHPDETPYVCSVCGEATRTLYEARLHRRVHTVNPKDSSGDTPEEEKKFICEECGMCFIGRRKLASHLRGHRLSVAEHECTTCGLRFLDKRRLTVHTRLHTGEKPFACTECGKRFTQSSALHTHALLHSGQKPHGCDLCGKAFRIKADRDNHRRTHTGEKPYKCEFCFKTFRTGQVYYQHRMIHTGERRFPCNICGKAFKRSHTLVVHRRIHTGEKPNICDICGKGFRQRTDMRKHRALHGT